MQLGVIVELRAELANALGERDDYLQAIIEYVASECDAFSKLREAAGGEA